MAAPGDIRDALARVHPEVNEIYTKSRAGEEESARADNRRLIGVLSQFIWDLGVQAPGGEESIKEFVRQEYLKHWLGASLNTNFVSVESTHEFDLPTLASKVLEYPSALVPLVQDGKLFRVIERSELASRIAKTVLKEQLKR